MRQLGDVANAQVYSDWADKPTAAARAQFQNPNTPAFGDRLQENVMAILSDTATPKETGDIYERFIRPENPSWKTALAGNLNETEIISPYYGYFVLQVMKKVGRPQDGVAFIRRYGGDMIRRGAATFWEQFDPAWPDPFQAIIDKLPYLSLSHGWSSGPTSFLTETILGVRPIGAGYSKVEIAPNLADLAWAEGDVPVPGGAIHVRADRNGNQSSVTVKLPAGVRARIQLGPKAISADNAGTYSLVSP